MADMIAAQHALKLESVRKAKEEVYASYAERIAALEQELAQRTDVPIYSSNAAAPVAPFCLPPRAAQQTLRHTSRSVSFDRLRLL